MSMFNDISWRFSDNDQECERRLRFYLCEKNSPERWSFLGFGAEKKWLSIRDNKPQGEWDRVAELMKIKITKSGHPVFRATSPLSRGTLQYTFLRRFGRKWKFLSLSNLCEEY